MGIFRQFPYSNFHEMNLDWIINKVKDLNSKWDSFVVNWENEVRTEVNKWLTLHPEYTTTVMDGSITEQKFTDELKTKTIKDYVTPEMYGAIGDGVADDSEAVQATFDSGYDVLIANEYYCASTINITDAFMRTVTGLDINKSKLQFGNNAQLIIGSNSNVNELRLNNFAIVGNRTQYSVLKIQNVTNVYLHHINVAEGGSYLVELDHADIVFMDSCIFAGSNIIGIWQPCSGIKMTSANPVYVTQCNIWNVINAFEIIGINRTLNLSRNWIEFVQRVVYATNTLIANCNIEVSENNIVFSVHGSFVDYTNSRIVFLNNITTGFDITINVVDNFINYYVTNPTEALVELVGVTSTVNVNILRNNMFTRLQQMNAYALKVDARNSTRLNYEANTNADEPFGCATASIINTSSSPTKNQVENLNVLSDQKAIVANQHEGDFWYENGQLYMIDDTAIRTVVHSLGEAITDISDPDTASASDVARKLNALMYYLRRTAIIR